VNILKIIKNVVFVIGLSFSVVGIAEPGFVLQNNSAVTDSSNQCVRTGVTTPESTPDECGGEVQAAVNESEPDPNQTFGGCEKIQCEPESGTGSINQVGNEVITAEIPFRFDQSDLTSVAKRKLDEFISAVSQRVSNIISVFGHTDSLGTDEYNDNLSEKRADSVKSYLIGAGIPRNDITVKGMGESSPVADNETRDGRAKNRRVAVEAK